MEEQSTDLYTRFMCGMLALGLACFVGNSANAATVEQDGFPSNTLYVKDLKIQGALAALNDAWPEVQSRALSELDALNALDRIEPARLPRIVLLLRYPDLTVRLTALNILGKIGEPATEFLPQIAALLVNDELDVRVAATRAIGKLAQDWQDVYIPQLAILLDDQAPTVRMAAIQALGKLDPEGQSYLPVLHAYLTSPEAVMRAEGVTMVENLGEIAEAYVPDIVELIGDPEPDVRRTAVIVLGRLGIPDARAVSQIAERLHDQEWRVRVAAAHSLCRMSPLHQAYMPQILALLDDDAAVVRSGVIGALSTLRQGILPYLPQILERDADPNPEVRAAVLDVFSGLGDDAEPYLDFITERLDDDQWEVRAAAVRAFGNLQTIVPPALPLLVPLFQDTDWYVRSYAIKALGALVSPYDVEQDLMNSLLRDKEGNVRAAAVWVLGNWEQAAMPYLPQLLELIHDPHAGVRQATLRAIRNLGQVPVKAMLTLIEQIETDRSQTVELRFLTHSVGTGEQFAEVLLRWVGNPAVSIDMETLSYEQARHTLEVFAIAEHIDVDAPRILGRLAELSGQMITRMKPYWSTTDIALLEPHAAYLRTHDSSYSPSARQIVRWLKIQWILKNPLLQGIAIAMFHPLAWLGLCILYPYSKRVRTMFFWNPYARWGLGLGYIHFALIKLPFFRKRFFLPYRRALLSDADLAHFDAVMYMKDVTVLDERTRRSLPIHQAIPMLQGKIVLEGASGLGKTMFVRYLLTYCIRPVAYLPAEKCTEGIAEAILPKLRGECRDESFLRALVCEGAVDLCIDGLDAISARNRAKVSHFVMYNCRGNILITTRPTEWTPRQGYATYRMHPLRQEHIEGFLRMCYRLLPDDIPMSRSEYVHACDAYLQIALGVDTPDKELTEHQQVLTNPMNLTLVALLCAYGKTPDLSCLMEQCYHLVAAAYQQQHDDCAFPLLQFSERVYRMRLNDEGVIPHQRFEKEIDCMMQYVMILSRTSFDMYGNPVTEWYFRHETIVDFFILQAFLEENNHRVDRHLDDSRFKGVYALLGSDDGIEDEELATSPHITYLTETTVSRVSKAL